MENATYHLLRELGNSFWSNQRSDCSKSQGAILGLFRKKVAIKDTVDRHNEGGMCFFFFKVMTLNDIKWNSQPSHLKIDACQKYWRPSFRCIFASGRNLTGAKPLVLVSEIPDSSKSSFFHVVTLLTSGWSTHRHGLQQQLDRSRPNDLGRLGPWFSLQGEKIEASAGHVGPNPFPQPPWEVVLHEY